MHKTHAGLKFLVILLHAHGCTTLKTIEKQKFGTHRVRMMSKIDKKVNFERGGVRTPVRTT